MSHIININRADMQIGIEKLCFLHLNDSKAPPGSRSDRHWHIGKGDIGANGFRLILNHPLLNNLSGIMETPGKTEKDDLENIKMLRNLSEK